MNGLTVRLARVMGPCFGVERALAMARSHKTPGDLTILGQLVHNPQTAAELSNRGIRAVEGVEELGRILTKEVMITAHGCSAQVRLAVEKAGFTVLDATCPLVHLVHRTVQDMVASGLFPVVIGEEKHVEVRGIVGDLAEYLVIREAADIERLPPEKRRRIGLVSQTTQNEERVEAVAAALRARPDVEELVFVNTVCRPTRERQQAVTELAREVELMLVVGGRNSSNTRQMRLLCEALGTPTRHLESPDELDPAWFEGRRVIGIVAGTSTPMAVVDAVHQAVLRLDIGGAAAV